LLTWKASCKSDSERKSRCGIARAKGALEVKFFNDDDLERILQIMGLDLE
jgi:hypothetical protein